MFDRLLVKILIWRLRRGWGGNCETYDYEDFPELSPRELNHPQRCGSCQAKEVIEWLGHGYLKKPQPPVKPKLRKKN